MVSGSLRAFQKPVACILRTEAESQHLSGILNPFRRQDRPVPWPAGPINSKQDRTQRPGTSVQGGILNRRLQHFPLPPLGRSRQFNICIYTRSPRPGDSQAYTRHSRPPLQCFTALAPSNFWIPGWPKGPTPRSTDRAHQQLLSAPGLSARLCPPRFGAARWQCM